MKKIKRKGIACFNDSVIKDVSCPSLSLYFIKLRIFVNDKVKTIVIKTSCTSLGIDSLPKVKIYGRTETEIPTSIMFVPSSK